MKSPNPPPDRPSAEAREAKRQAEKNARLAKALRQNLTRRKERVTSDEIDPAAPSVGANPTAPTRPTEE